MILKGRNFIKVTGGGGPVDPEEPIGNSMKFAITYDAPPLSVSLTRPRIKHNKEGVFCPHVDDGTWRWGNPLISFLNSLTYTDGCGVIKAFKAAIAINTGTGNPGDEFYNPAFLQEPEMRQFINLDWDFMNHGNIHSPVPTAIVDTNKLHDRIAQRVNYRMRSTAIPNNDAGYANAASLRNYKACVSQGDYFDQFNPPIRWHKVMTEPAYSTMNQNGRVTCMIREFNDEWALTNTGWHTYIRGEINNLLTSLRDFLLLGTHSPCQTTPLLDGFKSVMQYVKDTTNDKVLVCSPREFVEYLEMRLFPMSYEVSGNQLIVTINTANLDDNNRWRDMSFVSGGSQTILNVEAVTGIDSVSFNPATRLINTYKQKKIWN